MKSLLITAALTAAGLAAPAIAQTAAPASATAAAAAAPLSVQTTPISEIIKNPAAKAALEKALPAIASYYDQIGGMTLAQLAPQSQGMLDDQKLKDLQAEFDKAK